MIIAKTKGRAAVAGNPADAYMDDAKVIAYAIDREAKVSVKKSNEPVIQSDFSGDHILVEQALKHFRVPEPLRIAYNSDVPFRCGLGGSAPILVSLTSALNKAFSLGLDDYAIAEHAMKIEHELGIAAGLQDRWAAVFGSCFMDFKNRSCQPLDEKPPFCIVCYGKDVSSGDIHNKGKQIADEAFMNRMKQTIGLAEKARQALENSDWKAVGEIMMENWDVRQATLGLLPKDAKIRCLLAENNAYGNQAGSAGAAIVYDPTGDFIGAIKEKPPFNIEILGICKGGAEVCEV